MMEENIKEQKKESVGTMKIEYLDKFCERKLGDGEFTGLGMLKINYENGESVSGKPATCMKKFMQHLCDKYSKVYDNLIDIWVEPGSRLKLTKEKMKSSISINLEVNGKKLNLYMSNPSTQDWFNCIQKILEKMKVNAEFEKDLHKLSFEYSEPGEKSNEQDDSQPLKNDIQKEDNSKSLAEKVKKAMKNKQIIFTGAPGTGKTYSVREVVEEETDGDKTAYKFVQFHPSYDYSDFVEGLRPVVLLGQTEPTFVRMDGTFKAFCRHVVEENKANDGEDEKYYFIVDEINRGDLSKIFGELMFGLEESYRGEENAFDTQYKNLKTYRVLETADRGSNICGKEILPEDIGHAVPIENDVFEKGFYIPKNLYFVGTMNDIDRSVDSMDFALRRRFMWMEIKANEVMKPSMLDMYSDQCEEIKKKIEGISERIVKMNEVMTSSDFRNLGLTEAYHIGPAYFKKLDPQNLEESLREVFDNNVVSILREYLRGRRKDEVDKLINTCKKNLFPEEKSSGEN